MDTSFQSPVQKKYISTINDSGYNESNDQVDKISDSKEQVDTSSRSNTDYIKRVDLISDPRIDTHITNGIKKLSIRTITFESVMIGQYLVMSVQDSSQDGILRESLKPLHTISLKEIVTDRACNIVQVDRIIWNPSRDIHMTQRVKIEVFSPICGRKSSFEKWSRNIEPLNTSVDGYAYQERNSKYFCIEKISVKSLPGEIITDLDPIKQVNLASSVFSEIPKFIYFGLSSFNATVKPNSVFAPSTREKRLNSTERENLNNYWIASIHDFERVSEMKAYSNHIKNSEPETRQVFERENIQTENIPLIRQTDFVTPLHENPQTRQRIF